ncbi:ABC transporter ATP-binding protein [Streptomyces sp. NPDC060286]|uniref:ABC transporter ATP-binding protein n=1 Tax=unclassified Streptomyces TaxID=2593676 RepID=UPI0035D9E432
MDGSDAGAGPGAVVARGVGKRFGGTVALERVDLTVGAGEVHGLLGPNGAGKTTFLRMVLGLVRPDEGELGVLGSEVRRAGRGGVEGLAGFVESPRFYPYLSAVRNLTLLAAYDGIGADEAAVDGALERVDLGGAARRKVGGFSFGMRQRLGIAAALLRRPRLLVLDEPANGLDPAGVRDMRALVRQLGRDGLTVLLSSHNMAEVEQLCDTVTIMNRGRIVYTGGLDELRDRAPDPAHRLLTGDDRAAVKVAADVEGLSAEDEGAAGLAVRARREALDRFVLELGRAGIPVRELRLETTSLEQQFLRLTEEVSDR